MLGSPILYLKGMRILMFQLSGFYCIGFRGLGFRGLGFTLRGSFGGSIWALQGFYEGPGCFCLKAF